MADVTLGKTQITVNKNGFGCLPIQRISKEEAAKLLRKAREKGITFFDTARAYSDSEEKLGEAFGGSWDDTFYVATKTAANTPEDFRRDLETSLGNLKRDYVDIYQFHNMIQYVIMITDTEEPEIIKVSNIPEINKLNPNGYAIEAYPVQQEIQITSGISIPVTPDAQNDSGDKNDTPR